MAKESGMTPNMAGNDGVAQSSSGSTKFLESYGKDDSDYTGPRAKERGGNRGGGIDNLSHSLSGTSANQKGA